MEEENWIKLNFENCEVIEIPRKYAVSADITGISRNIRATDTGIYKNLECSEAFIMISKKYLESNYMDENLYGSGVSLLDRIWQKDLVSVSFSEEPGEEFYVPYQGDNENEYEHVVTGSTFREKAYGDYVVIMVSENPSKSFSWYLYGDNSEDSLAEKTAYTGKEETDSDSTLDSYKGIEDVAPIEGVVTSQGVTITTPKATYTLDDLSKLVSKLDAASDKLDKVYTELAKKPTKEDWKNILES